MFSLLSAFFYLFSYFFHPRTLDLDLITTEGPPGRWTWETPTELRVLGAELSLELPHPRAFSRPFVLEPWRALSEPGDCGGVIPGGTDLNR